MVTVGKLLTFTCNQIGIQESRPPCPHHHCHNHLHHHLCCHCLYSSRHSAPASVSHYLVSRQRGITGAGEDGGAGGRVGVWWWWWRWRVLASCFCLAKLKEAERLLLSLMAEHSEQAVKNITRGSKDWMLGGGCCNPAWVHGKENVDIVWKTGPWCKMLWAMKIHHDKCSIAILCNESEDTTES